MFIKVIDSDRHFAQNGPTGIKISNGTRYFAAVLLQEWYEFVRFAAWFWGLPAFVWALAGASYFLGGADQVTYGLLATGLVLMLLVSMGIVPFDRDERELNGQAIEIAAIQHFYGRKAMESEYRLQARSMIRSDSPYVLKGYWPDVEPIDPNLYTNADAMTGTYHPSIERMVHRLKAREPFAKRYVLANWNKLEKWAPLGPGGLGY